jgi:integrase
MRPQSFHSPAELGTDAPARQVSAAEHHQQPLVTVAEYTDHWLRVATGQLRARTVANYRSQMQLHVLPRLGNRTLADVDEDDLLRMISELRAAGYTAWTIRTILTPLSRMLNHGVRRGLIRSNPVAGLDRSERPAVWGREQRILTRDEIRRLLTAARPQHRALLATAVFTGLRQGELLALTWSNIDFDGGAVKVREALDRQGRRIQPKTRNAIRDVVLMPSLVTKLEAHRAASDYASRTDYVFASKVGTPLYWRNLTPRVLRPALERANLETLRWHDLRHTFAALLIMQGANIAYVSRQMGHGSAEITLRVYSHVFDRAEYAQRIRQALESSFGALV